jgi:hypothetical protein
MEPMLLFVVPMRFNLVTNTRPRLFSKVCDRSSSSNKEGTMLEETAVVDKGSVLCDTSKFIYLFHDSSSPLSHHQSLHLMIVA